MKSILAVVVLALALPVLAFGKADVGKPAPAFALTGRDGKPVSLASFKGKIVVVDFWASWCKPCMKSLPALDALAASYKGKVVFVAVNIDAKQADADKVLTDKKITNLTVVYDPSSKVVADYEPPTMPSSYIIDQKGQIRFLNAGFNPGDEKTIAKQIGSL